MEGSRITPYLIYDGIRFDLIPVADGYLMRCPGCRTSLLIPQSAINEIGAICMADAFCHCGWHVRCQDGNAWRG